jgi:dihydrofolate reductase
MGRIVVSENVTLDGVVEDPAGVEGFKFGGWVGRIGDQDRDEAAKVLLDEALDAEAQLFGRRTYEFLAARWPSRSGELAERLNTMPKYVVSSTLEDPEWSNAMVLGGDVVHAVSQLGQELHGEIVVAGSLQLVDTLWQHDLVDELRLMVYPVVLGAGRRLFGEVTETKVLRPLETRTVHDLAYLTYEVVRPS